MLRLTNKNDKQKLIRLYNSVFPNEEEFCARFFDIIWSPEKSFVIEDFRQIQSMITYLPLKLNFLGKSFSASYIYAAATEKSSEKKGLMSRLIKETEKYFADGYDFLILLVQNEGLLNFYSRFGFKPLCIAGESKVLAGNNIGRFELKVAEKADFEEIIGLYNKETERFIKHKRDVEFLKNLQRLYDCEFYLLKSDDKILSYAFGYKEKEVFKCLEAIGKNRETLCSALADKFGCKESVFYFPDNKGKEIGMVKPLNSSASEILKKNPIYINLLYN